MRNDPIARNQLVEKLIEKGADVNCRTLKVSRVWLEFSCWKTDKTGADVVVSLKQDGGKNLSRKKHNYVNCRTFMVTTVNKFLFET